MINELVNEIVKRANAFGLQCLVLADDGKEGHGGYASGRTGRRSALLDSFMVGGTYSSLAELLRSYKNRVVGHDDTDKAEALAPAVRVLIDHCEKEGHSARVAVYTGVGHTVWSVGAADPRGMLRTFDLLLKH